MTENTKVPSHPIRTFFLAVCLLGCLVGCAETIYRIEMGMRYYTVATAATTMLLITLVYGIIAAVYSSSIYLAVLLNRRVTGRPREKEHIPHWCASLICASIGYFAVLIMSNKWIFTGFEFFSKQGLLYNIIMSLAYWTCALFLMKMITPRLVRHKYKFASYFYLVAVMTIIAAVGIVGMHLYLVGPARQSAATSDKNNLILISIDTLRRDRVGCFGSGLNTTPNIDRLQGESVLFRNAYCEIPLTNPSHVSMLTGLTIASHGNKQNYDRLGDETLTLASIMHRENYRTAAFVGAITLLDRLSNLSMGFEIYDDNLWVPAWVGDSFLLDAFSLLFFKIFHASVGIVSIPANEVMDRATRWIDDHAQQPFFVFIHLYDPHAPYDPPDSYAEMYLPASDSKYDVNNALYNAEVRYCDSEIGKFIDHLRQLDLLSRSLLVIISDHGEELGEKDGEFGHGYSLWEESIRIPFMMRMPEGESAPESRYDYCQVVDLVPTILPALRIDLPEEVEFDGRNLLAVNPSNPKPLFFQGSPKDEQCKFAVLDLPWKLIYLYDFEGDEKTLQKKWLFNIEDDPFETNRLLDRDSVGVIVGLQDHLDFYSDISLSQKHRNRRLSKDDIRKLRALGYLK